MKVDEIIQDVYNVSFDKQRELAETFLRFSEHYENPEFRGKIFSLDEFKEWYIQNSNQGKRKGKFTYYEDWDGFNIPSVVLEPFYLSKFGALSDKERDLLDHFWDIRKTSFYLIGTYGDVSIATKKHEISHGLFYTTPDYKKEALEVVKSMDIEDVERMHRFFRELGGYHPSVYDDEIQAYLVDRRCLGANRVSGKGLENAGRKIKKIYKKYFELKRK